MDTVWWASGEYRAYQTSPSRWGKRPDGWGQTRLLQTSRQPAGPWADQSWNLGLPAPSAELSAELGLETT